MALVLWAAMLLIGVCCPLTVATSPPGAPCHAPATPHCMNGMIEQTVADASLVPDPALLHFSIPPLVPDVLRDDDLVHHANVQAFAKRGMATFLFDEQLLI